MRTASQSPPEYLGLYCHFRVVRITFRIPNSARVPRVVKSDIVQCKFISHATKQFSSLRLTAFACMASTSQSHFAKARVLGVCAHPHSEFRTPYSAFGEATNYMTILPHKEPLCKNFVRFFPTFWAISTQKGAILHTSPTKKPQSDSAE